MRGGGVQGYPGGGRGRGGLLVRQGRTHASSPAYRTRDHPNRGAAAPDAVCMDCQTMYARIAPTIRNESFAELSPEVYSNVFMLCGMDYNLGCDVTDVFALSMRCDDTGLTAVQVADGNFCIAALDATGKWANAVDHNSDGTKKFVQGPRDPSDGLGTHGLDTELTSQLNHDAFAMAGKTAIGMFARSSPQESFSCRYKKLAGRPSGGVVAAFMKPSIRRGTDSSLSAWGTRPHVTKGDTRGTPGRLASAGGERAADVSPATSCLLFRACR